MKDAPKDLAVDTNPVVAARTDEKKEAALVVVVPCSREAAAASLPNRAGSPIDPNHRPWEVPVEGTTVGQKNSLDGKVFDLDDSVTPLERCRTLPSGTRGQIGTLTNP